jgi:hypothetical protein
MTLPKTPKTNCTEHLIDITKLQMDMATRVRHEEKIVSTLESLEKITDKLNENYFEVNSSLLRIKDVPDRLRKLEDKSITQGLIEKGLWFILGVGLSVFIQQEYVAIKERKEYKIESTK